MDPIAEFIATHFVEILLSIVSLCALGWVKNAYGKKKEYEKMIREMEQEKLNDNIDAKLAPIQHEIEELRGYIREVGTQEKAHLTLIVSSYRFRLVQLCREYIKKGEITPMQYEQLSEFYRVYEGLGGNGQAKEYYEKAIKLPMTKTE